MRLPVKPALALVAMIALAPGLAQGAERQDREEPARTGPAADYPVVVGEPFTIGSTVWTPNDQLNYDAVGMARVGDAALVGVTGAHKTLPLPSYVEVTNLETGRTILVRLEKRGPMVNSVLIELSPDAARQLGIASGTTGPVRVRRVNPPERERAMLRQGGEAPLRMDTPPGLLNVLREKLAEQSPLLPPPSTPPTPPKVTSAMMVQPVGPGSPESNPPPSPEVSGLPGSKVSEAAARPSQTAEPSAKAPPSEAAAKAEPPAKADAAPAPVPATRGTWLVQVGAFSNEDNARKLAADLGGFVAKPGRFWLVRLGPFKDRAKAAPALEKARKAGYSDARIQRGT